MDNQEQINLDKQNWLVAKMIYDADFRSEITFLESQDFYEPSARKIFQTLKRLDYKHIPIDRLSVSERCPGVEIPKKSSLPKDIDYRDLARRLHEDGNKWRSKLLLDEFLSQVDNENFEFNSALSRLIDKLTIPTIEDSNIVTADILLNEFYDYLETKPEDVCIGKFGLPTIDAVTEGIELGRVYVIEAGQSVGKSLLGNQVFHESMLQGTPCLMLSNEMLREDILSRLLARVSGINPRDIKKGRISDTNRYLEGVATLHDLLKSTKSVIVDKAHDIEKSKNLIKFCVRKFGTKLVVVDHLQNFISTKELYDRISNIAHEFQRLAQELNISIILLSQLSTESLNRDIEKISAKGSKDVDEVANVVLILQRKKVLLPNETRADKENDPNWIHVIMTKNRDGDTTQTWAEIKKPNLTLREEIINEFRGM